MAKKQNPKTAEELAKTILRVRHELAMKTDTIR